MSSERKPKRTKYVATHTAHAKADNSATMEMMKIPLLHPAKINTANLRQITLNLTDSQQKVINDLRTKVTDLDRKLMAEKMRQEAQKVVMEMQTAEIARLHNLLDSLLATDPAHTEAITALATGIHRNPISPPSTALATESDDDVISDEPGFDQPSEGE